jgi:hypothetical protein
MGLEGRQKTERIYSLRTHLERIENLYLHLLERGQSSEKR